MLEVKSHTALRGIAALLVVVYHFRETLNPAIELDAHTQFFAKGYLWVDCFFILSGFILCYVYGTRPGDSVVEAKQFFWARFARIYPLHLATLLFLAAYYLLIPALTRKHFSPPSWPHFWLNIFLVHAWGILDAYDWNFPSWSISVEFAAYLLFPLICFCVVRAPRITFGIILVAFLVALTIGHDHWERTAIYRGLPLFGMGVVLFYLGGSGLPPMVVNMMQIAATALLTISLHFGLPDGIITLTFGVLIFSIRFDTGPFAFLAKKPFLMLGAWSYSIYMLHIPVRFAMSQLAPHLGPIAGFTTLIFATLIAGAASHHLFEMPARRFLRSISFVHSTPHAPATSGRCHS